MANLKRVHFHGVLAERFGSGFDLDIRTPGEAFRALFPQLNGLREIIEPGRWTLIRGDLATGQSIGEDELELGLGGDDLHIMPALEGASDDGGLIKTIVGAVLIVVGVIFYYQGGQYLINAGIAMMAGGVAMMLAPTPNQNDPNENRKQNFMFNGPVNVSAQGHPVPIVYGEMRVGSVVVSSGISTEKTTFSIMGGGWQPGNFNPILVQVD